MEFISLMEIIGTVAFAVSGALAAIEKTLVVRLAALKMNWPLGRVSVLEK